MELSGALVYVDERLVVVNKPPGVSLATPRTDPGAAAARLLACVPADQRSGFGLAAGDLHLVHRLDVGTSGLVLLARDEDAHRDLVATFSARRVDRAYLALVWGHPRPAEGRWDLPLGPDRRDRRRMVVEPGGRPAATGFSTLARAPHVALLRLVPATGRTHQLRVHLTYAGHPIVGDDLYGGPRHRGVRDMRLREVLSPPHALLHAWRLHLPATHATPELFLEAALPTAFAVALDALAIPLATAT